MEKTEIEAHEAIPSVVPLHEKQLNYDATQIASSQFRAIKSKEEKRMLLKVDLVILPLSALCYFVAYLDRNSIGNARIMGLQKDLHMTPDQFYNCLTLFFVGYIALMLPANLLNRVLTPNWSLGVAVIGWGATLCGMSRAKNYVTVLILRLILGFGQAFVQTLSVYTSLWYKRDELASRSAVYYGCSTLSGAFGGLIAYGIDTNLGNSSFLPPWGWLFLIEGVLAIGVGLAVIVLLPHYPDILQKRSKKHWLFTREEINLATQRFSSFNTRGEKIRASQLLAVLKDPKSYMFAICQGAAVLGISNVGSFLPTFINNFGYSTLHTQLFTIIPYAFATVSIFTCGILSDRWNTKAPFLLVAYGITCLGYIILLATANPVAGVVATVLVTTGCYVPVLLLPVWAIINTAGYTKRSGTWVFCECFGLTWAIMGTRIYNKPPRFVKGHSVVLAINVLSILCVIAAAWWMRRLNRKKDQIEQEYADRGETHPHIAESLTLEDVQDNHISFRYVI